MFYRDMLVMLPPKSIRIWSTPPEYFSAADEDEVILRAGTRFLITSIKLWKHGITEVRMAEVDSVSNVADEPVAYNEIDHYMALDPEVEVIYAVAAEMVGAAQDSAG